MCGRFTLKTPAKALADLFGLSDLPQTPPRYNVAPTQGVLCVRQAGAGPEAASLRWGLIPGWAKDAAIGNKLLNARSETVAEKPAFRSAFRHRRCLIAGDGFYEWERLPGGKKRPWHFRLADGQPFGFAGLWERWDGPQGPVESCTLITDEPNELVRPVHDRMPVILPPERHTAWLDAGNPDGRGLAGLLVPYPADAMEAWPVSAAVNSPWQDGPELIEPAE